MKEGKCLRLEDIKSPQDIKGLSYAEMNDLAAQIRTELVTTISKRGGHLASNLGVVELTMAIHRVFNMPEDKIVFDVGHQSYVRPAFADGALPHVLHPAFLRRHVRLSRSAPKANMMCSRRVMPLPRCPQRWGWRAPAICRGSITMCWRWWAMAQ